MMNKSSIVDYLSCILFKTFGALIRRLPFGFSLFLGRRLGDIFYYFDAKHKAIAYSNLKTAFGSVLPPEKLNIHLRDFYRSFGQTLIEFFIFPLIDKEYIDKYITLEGLDNIAEGFKMGKGVLLSVAHEGSWEISNIISANMGYPFNVVIRDQVKYELLNRLLNSYRMQKGSKLIETKNQTKKIIEALLKNEALAITVDQGGKAGEVVKFFGKNASMSTGAVRLALKYGAAIIPIFSTRTNGPYMKFIIEKPFQIKQTGDKEKDVRENLQRLISIFEKYITMYPKEYLWTYKIWKYTNEKNILILSDGKAGHLRQSQGAVNIISAYFKDKQITGNIKTIETRLKNRVFGAGLALCSSLAGKYCVNCCLRCLKACLKQDIYESIVRFKPDIVISCGSSLAAINLVISRQNLAKSVVIMRPSVLSTKRFDLVIMQQHDWPGGSGLASYSQSHRPGGHGLASDSQSHRHPKRRNIVVTDGALNLIDEEYLKSQELALRRNIEISKEFVLGLLIGGNSKDFRLDVGLIKEVSGQLKLSLDKLDGQVLISTSRRTSPEVESLLTQGFSDYRRCKLLVIANQKNIPEAVGGILALSRVIVTSPESISMISEAVNSKKYVIVFDVPGLSAKHRRFLELFAGNKYINLVKPGDLGGAVEDIWKNKPAIFNLEDNSRVKERLKRIL